jgi:hypothetical protein
MTWRPLMVLAVIGVLLADCASTALTSSWLDPAYRGQRFKSVLVVGWTDRAEARQQFEDVFVGALKASGVAAVASYTVLPAMTKEQDAVAAAARLPGVDGVIITRLVDTQATPSPVPVQPYSSADMALYRNTTPSAPVLTVGQSTQKESVLETDVFEVPAGKMIWWGRTSSFDTDDSSSVGRGTAARVIGALRSDKLI